MIQEDSTQGPGRRGTWAGPEGATKRKEVMPGCALPHPGAQGGPEAQISQLLGQLS